MKTNRKSTTNTGDKLDEFYNDYLEIMKTKTSDFISKTEWNSLGDQFEKLTMYDEYTPVETSSNTKLPDA